MLGSMRYRLHVSRTEFAAVLVPLLDGAMKMYDHHSHSAWALSRWHGLVHQAYLYFIFIAPVLLYLRHRYSYVELTPSELEYGSLWRKRTIQYWQMERIVCGAVSLDKVGCGLTQVYGHGMKRLDLRVDRTPEFIAELTHYAPQALLEGTE
jgi:hypothetical protein